MRFRVFGVSFCAVVATLGTGVSSTFLTGCSSTHIASSVGTSGYEGQGLSGTSRIGQQPLIGASVQLYAAGTSGNGTNGVGLLSNVLTTDSTGAFSVPAGYNCPSANSQLYLVARGGEPGATASANNSIALLTALGACNAAASTTPVVINEVTTAAAVYALAQFLSAGGNLGASSTNAIGLKNAVATAQALANITTGISPGPAFAANGSSPAPKINTLANLLNSCVSATTSAIACNELFSATTTPGETPANTLDAALNLVRNPAQNVAALYALASSSSAFAPALSTQPSDWTLSIAYKGGGMKYPTTLGVDGAGNVWVANFSNVASLFSPLGAPLFAQGITGSGLSDSFGLAVDANNNAWITNWPNPGFVAGNTVSVFNSSGASMAGSSGYSTGALTYPNSVAIDTDGSAWIADWGDSQLTHLSSSGQQLSGSPYSSSELIDPFSAAIDASHNVWVSNEGGTTVTRVTPDGSQFTSYNCCNGPEGLAIDQRGNVWVPNYDSDSISELSNSGTVLSSGFTSASLADPDYIAIDGAGTVWICSYRSPSLTELAGSNASVPGTVLSPAAGLGSDAQLLEAYALAIDASGNVWVSNEGDNTLTQFIGLAAPVRTPQIGPAVAP